MVAASLQSKAPLSAQLPTATWAESLTRIITEARDVLLAAPVRTTPLAPRIVCSTMTTTPAHLVTIRLALRTTSTVARLVAAPGVNLVTVNLPLTTRRGLRAKRNVPAQLQLRVLLSAKVRSLLCLPQKRPGRPASVIFVQPTVTRPSWAKARPSSLPSIP